MPNYLLWTKTLVPSWEATAWLTQFMAVIFHLSGLSNLPQDIEPNSGVYPQP